MRASPRVLILMDENTRMVITAVIAATPPTIAALTALIVAMKGNAQQREFAAITQGKIDKVDGDLVKFIQASTATAKVEGKLEGIEAGLKMGSDASSKTVVLPDRRAGKGEEKER